MGELVYSEEKDDVGDDERQEVEQVGNMSHRPVTG